MLLGHGTHGSVYEEDGKAVKVYRDFPLIPPEAFNEHLIHSAQNSGNLVHDPSCTYKLTDKSGHIGKWKLYMKLYEGNALQYTYDMTFAQRYAWIKGQRKNFVEALLLLHVQGWTHGDINPKNILVDKEGNIVLCDFSLTNIACDDVKYGYTEGFAAPECDITLRHFYSDWWSLGATCYYILYRTYYSEGCNKKLPSFVRRWLSRKEIERAPPSPYVPYRHTPGSLEVNTEEIKQTLETIRDRSLPSIVMLAERILCYIASHIELELLHYPVAMELSTKHILRQSLVRDVEGDYEEFRLIEQQMLELLHYRLNL